MIPEQLQKQEYRFIRVRPQEKRPQDPAWQKTNNFSYKEDQVQRHLINGGNYGVATGYGNLLVVDFDDEEFQKLVFEQLPRTFGVKTGRGGLHLYYTVDDAKSSKITTSNGKTLVDLQGNGKQVVGPGSTHPNGKKYSVLINAPIEKIERERLNAILHANGQSGKITGKMRPCPYHDDKHASMAYYDDGSFYCFGCQASGEQAAINNPDAKTKQNKSGGTHHYLPRKKERRMSRNTEDLIEADAQEIIEEAGIVFDPQARIFMKWEKGRYRRLMPEELLQVIRENSGIAALLQQRELESLKRVITVLALEKFRTLNPQGLTVSFGGVGYDYGTGRKRTIGKDTFMLNSLPWKPGTNTKTPTIDRLLESWVGKSKAGLLKDLAAYMCLPQNPLKLIVFTYGPANSGKSTYNRILEQFLGKHNSHSSTFRLITDSRQRFETGNLRGKLACFGSEVDGKEVHDTTPLKQLSGGDTLRGEYKQGEVFLFTFQGKAIFACNDLPQIKNEKDNAFKGRALVIDFPRSFNPKEDVALKIPNEEFHNLAAWCLERLQEWKTGNEIRLRGAPEWEERVVDFTRRTNPIQTFCDEYVEFDEDNEPEYSDYSILCKDFRNKFNEYQISKAQKEWDEKRIGAKLKQTFKDKFERGKSSVTYINREGKTVPYWEYRGMRVREPNTKMANNTKGGDLQPIYREQVHPLGNNGHLGNRPSIGRFRKLADKVFHKCVMCDLSPCEYEDEHGRPVCELCATHEVVE